MSDLALDLDPLSTNLNDLQFSGNDLVLTSSTLQDVQQSVLQRLRTFYGEWFLDNTVGLPYFQQILVKNPEQSKIDALFVNTILGTPGVVQLNKYSFVPDFTNRTLRVSFSARCTTGTVDYAGLVTA
jgi:hypothetical protein